MVFAERAVFHAIRTVNSGLEQFGGVFGRWSRRLPFLDRTYEHQYLARDLQRSFGSMRDGTYDEGRTRNAQRRTAV